MSLRQGLYFSFIFFATGLMIISYLLFQVDPTTAGAAVKAIFFVAFFLTLVGLLAPTLFYWRHLSSNREVLYAEFPPAARQAVLISLLAVSLLLLQSLRALSWWDAILLVVGIGFIELAMRGRK